MNAVCRIAVGLAAAVALSGPVAALVEEPIEADIPFEFVIERTTLPAGKYVVEPLDSAEAGPMIARSRDDRFEVIFSTEDSGRRDPEARSELIFDEVDGTYYLCQIRQAGISESSVLPACNAEPIPGEKQSAKRTRHVVRARTVQRAASDS